MQGRKKELYSCISLSLFPLLPLSSRVTSLPVSRRSSTLLFSPFSLSLSYARYTPHGIYTRYRLLERAVNFLWGYYAAHTNRDSYRRRTSSVLAGSRTGSVYYLGLWGHPRASSLLLFLEAGFRGRPDGRDIRVDFQACFTLFARHFNIPAIVRGTTSRFFERLEKWIPDLRLNTIVDGIEELVKDEL